MKMRKLYADDEAVSPVIGVILMVAITVILAAVIATFVLGLGDQVSNTAPQASFTFDFDEVSSAPSGNDDLNNAWSSSDGNLTITHAGGATIDAGRLGVTGHSSGSGNEGWDTEAYGTNSEISAGDDLLVYVSYDDTVRVTWESEEGSSSATLGDWEGPEA